MVGRLRREPTLDPDETDGGGFAVHSRRARPAGGRVRAPPLRAPALFAVSWPSSPPGKDGHGSRTRLPSCHGRPLCRPEIAELETAGHERRLFGGGASSATIGCPTSARPKCRTATRGPYEKAAVRGARARARSAPARRLSVDLRQLLSPLGEERPRCPKRTARMRTRRALQINTA